MTKLPPKLPAIAINLLPEDPFIDSFVGKFLIWALSIGRYIVVLTELIVIVSFLSRFKLDRNLTDLNEAIEHQKVVILSYEKTESDFKAAQKNINFIKQTQTNNTVLDTLAFLEKNLPIDVKLDTLNIGPTNWSVKAATLSAGGMKTAVDQIIRTNPQSEVSVKDIKLDNKTGEINFAILVTLKRNEG